MSRADSKKHDFETSAAIRRVLRQRFRESSPNPTVHRTVEDHLNCPNCYPKFEKAMLDKGYRKPDLCPKCNTALERDSLGFRYCPSCRWRPFL